MASHHDWQEEIIKAHDKEKPFSPENGTPLKFAIGDKVTFTNGYGVQFDRTIVGLYQPEKPCSMYARGYRYLVDSDSPWFPVKESSLAHRAN